MKLEESEKRMSRDFSFASSEFQVSDTPPHHYTVAVVTQVVSSTVSQSDSEEEWKVNNSVSE